MEEEEEEEEECKERTRVSGICKFQMLFVSPEFLMRHKNDCDPATPPILHTKMMLYQKFEYTQPWGVGCPARCVRWGEGLKQVHQHSTLSSKKITTKHILGVIFTNRDQIDCQLS
jgi:hypothetical protein